MPPIFTAMFVIVIASKCKKFIISYFIGNECLLYFKRRYYFHPFKSSVKIGQRHIGHIKLMSGLTYITNDHMISAIG